MAKIFVLLFVLFYSALPAYALASFSDLRLAMPASELAQAKELFAYAEYGHFADKTQYDSVKAGEQKEIYSIHCRNGRAFGIEVKFPAAGVSRETAIKKMSLLIQGLAGKETEHDDDDLKKKDCSQACEFFYFENGVRAELLYARQSFDKVVQISVWKK
ncbi:MAG: hypothetical protein K2W82_12375 [Candidatus Obscuribacterales bacterium]|nr:hypothetical protein [Candidatus Obscuribacterales bacterium]